VFEWFLVSISKRGFFVAIRPDLSLLLGLLLIQYIAVFLSFMGFIWVCLLMVDKRVFLSGGTLCYIIAL